MQVHSFQWRTLRGGNRRAWLLSWMCKTQRTCFLHSVGSKYEITVDHFFCSFQDSTVFCLETAMATSTISNLRKWPRIITTCREVSWQWPLCEGWGWDRERNLPKYILRWWEKCINDYKIRCLALFWAMVLVFWLTPFQHFQSQRVDPNNHFRNSDHHPLPWLRSPYSKLERYWPWLYNFSLLLPSCYLEIYHIMFSSIREDKV